MENEKTKQQRELEFLQKNATKVVRVSTRPEFFYETDKEMNGKYGWFSSYGKSYNIPEFYTGWVFETAEKRQEFFNLK